MKIEYFHHNVEAIFQSYGSSVTNYLGIGTKRVLKTRIDIRLSSLAISTSLRQKCHTCPICVTSIVIIGTSLRGPKERIIGTPNCVLVVLCIYVLTFVSDFC